MSADTVVCGECEETAPFEAMCSNLDVTCPNCYAQSLFYQVDNEVPPAYAVAVAVELLRKLAPRRVDL